MCSRMGSIACYQHIPLLPYDGAGVERLALLKLSCPAKLVISLYKSYGARRLGSKPMNHTFYRAVRPKKKF